MSAAQSNSAQTVAILGGGIAGMSAACALAESGYLVHLIERRGYLGGRASSYRHPGVDETIDNCQHALFGCCTNLLAFYHRLGVEDKIHWTSRMTMIEPGGRRSLLAPSPLPAPLHGLPRLLMAPAFTLADKLSLARAFSAILGSNAANPNESLASWLGRHHQSPGAMNRFWRLVIASAHNADLDQIGMNYASMVIRGLFMDSARAGQMGVSSVPLSQLYAPVPEFLSARGGAVHLNTGVEGAAFDSATRQWTVYTRSGEFQADSIVLAMSFEAVQKLLPHLPLEEGREILARQIERHQPWPICSVHLWFDRPITDLPHAVLLDRQMHWMYNQSLAQSRPGNYVELVVSASRAFAALDRKAAIDLALAELAEFFPEVKSARLEKSALVKEMHATFGVPPGIDSARPSAVSPWPQLFLAGDWTATHWPSTMESAARSGHLAAEALTLASGDPLAFQAPALKPRGLMRWL
jgi:zeta-carotene desaturase